MLVGTSNPGKLRELSALLADVPFELVSLADAGVEYDVEETGATLEENASLKAETYCRLSGLPVLADDSGLEVDALGGAPGVLSARYGGERLDDAARNRKLLEALEGVAAEQRGARFRCILAVARSGKTLATFEGVVEGRILDEPRGHNGFGYDPLFFHPESGCTTAELTTDAKQRISHRGQAIAALLAALEQGDPRLAAPG